MTANPRDLAVTALERVVNGAYSNIQLDALIRQHALTPADRGLLTTIVYGTIQHRLTLDYQLAPFIAQAKKVAPWVQSLLLSAMFQMIYLDRVPNRAIFNESINIAKRRGHEGTRRFVTGVLHAIDRQGLLDPTTEADPMRRLSLTYSMPQWIVEKLTAQLGADKCRSILQTINTPAHQSIRVNQTKTTRDQLAAELRQDGYDVQLSPVSDAALILSGQPANQSQWFKAGWFTIQDESAMLPVGTMALTPAMHVLDACAAPGGKTTQIAEALDPTLGGSVMGLDIHAKKTALIEANAQRLGVADRVATQALDARRVDSVFADQTFDRILVDAPCSGLGLIRRKPEIRYEKQPEDLHKLQQIQLAILTAVAPKLKVGGQLVYSTCTIFDEENAQVAAAFLDSHPEFEAVRVTGQPALKPDRETTDLKIYPDDYGSDGFFVSSFVKQR